MFSTRGMPTRSFLRASPSAECALSRFVPELRDAGRDRPRSSRLPGGRLRGRRKSTKFGYCFFDLVEAGLDVLHVVDIFDRAFFAGGDDQPLLAVHQRNFGDFFYRNEARSSLGAVRMSMKVRRQLFLQKLQRVSSLRVVRYSILRTASNPTKRGAQAVAPQAQRLRPPRRSRPTRRNARAR